MHINELIGAIDAAEGPSRTLDRLVAERIGGNLSLPYTATLPAARAALPDGWGYVLDASPDHNPYCEAIGPKKIDYRRLGATAATQELALLSAAMRAQRHVRFEQPMGSAHAGTVAAAQGAV